MGRDKLDQKPSASAWFNGALLRSVRYFDNDNGASSY